MKANVLYLTGREDNGTFIPSMFIEKCDGIIDDNVSIAVNRFGIPGLHSLKKRGYNVLFFDFSIMEYDIDGGVEAIKTFFKKTPRRLVVLFCEDERSLSRARGNTLVKGLTEHVYVWKKPDQFEGICEAVRKFAV